LEFEFAWWDKVVALLWVKGNGKGKGLEKKEWKEEGDRVGKNKV